MKIRRTRIVPWYKYEDKNPYIPEKERPRYAYTDRKLIEEFDNAKVQQLDRNHRFPGRSVMLRVPMTDPETGRKTDADGDQALLRITMIGASMEYIGGWLEFHGFVSKQELLHEEAYRNVDLDKCLKANDRDDLDAEYVREIWELVP